MNDQDEIFEAATETPVSLGCPSLVPPQVIVHDEPARDDDERAKEVGARQDASESSPLQCRNRKGECDSKRKSTPREPLPVQLLQRLKGRIADWDALADRFYKAREEDRGRILCEALDIELRPVSKEGSKCQ